MLKTLFNISLHSVYVLANLILLLARGESANELIIALQFDFALRSNT